MPANNPSSARPRRVAVLGSTGSIGTSALDVDPPPPRPARTRRPRGAFASGNSSPSSAGQFKPRVAVLCDPEAFRGPTGASFPRETELLGGPDAVAKLVDGRGCRCRAVGDRRGGRA